MTPFKKKQLQKAVQDRDLTTVRMLLDSDTSLLRKHPKEVAFLFQAIRDHQPDLLKLLCDYDAKTSEISELFCLAMKEGQIECGQILLRHFSSWACFGDSYSKKTPLHYAAEAGNIEFTLLLLSQGADATKTDFHNKTPLKLALDGDHLDIATLLLESTYADKDPLTKLQWAHENFGKKLADAYLTKLRHSGEGVFFLHQAIKRGYDVEIIDLLLDNGYDINLPSAESGVTALHLAAAQGLTKTVLHLLERGADPHIEDATGYRPFEYARQNGHEETISRLAVYETTEETKKWRPLQGDRIAYVTLDEGIGYKLTEIFNFARREHTVIHRNIKTNAESSIIRNFDDIAEKEPLEEALRQLAATGDDTKHLSINGIIKNKIPLRREK